MDDTQHVSTELAPMSATYGGIYIVPTNTIGKYETVLEGLVPYATRIRDSINNIKKAIIKKLALAENLRMSIDEIPGYIASIPWKSGATFLGQTISECRLSRNILKIPEYAFYGRSSLASITAPKSYKDVEGDVEIGDHAFDGCVELASLPDGLVGKSVSIGAYFLKGCKKIAKITIPPAASISGKAFRGSHLSEVDANGLVFMYCDAGGDGHSWYYSTRYPDWVWGLPDKCTIINTYERDDRVHSYPVPTDPIIVENPVVGSGGKSKAYVFLNGTRFGGSRSGNVYNVPQSEDESWWHREYHAHSHFDLSYYYYCRQLGLKAYNRIDVAKRANEDVGKSFVTHVDVALVRNEFIYLTEDYMIYFDHMWEGYSPKKLAPEYGKGFIPDADFDGLTGNKDIVDAYVYTTDGNGVGFRPDAYFDGPPEEKPTGEVYYGEEAGRGFLPGSCWKNLTAPKVFAAYEKQYDWPAFFVGWLKQADSSYAQSIDDVQKSYMVEGLKCSAKVIRAPMSIFDPSAVRGMFRGCSNLKRVYICRPGNTKIMPGCFSGCTSLEEIIFPYDGQTLNSPDIELVDAESTWKTKPVMVPLGRSVEEIDIYSGISDAIGRTVYSDVGIIKVKAFDSRIGGAPKKIVFRRMRVSHVKKMVGYPWGLPSGTTIECSDGKINL